MPVWDGDILEFKPRMQYSAITFSAPTRVMFDALKRDRDTDNIGRARRSCWPRSAALGLRPGACW